MNKNNVTLKAYNSSGTLIKGSGLNNAEGLTFSTIYPAGLFAEMSFFVPRDPTAPWAIKLNNRIVAKNGLNTCWEGYVTNIAPSLDESREGLSVTCLGAWGNFMMQRKTQKFWAITGVDDDVWRPPTAADSASDRSLEDMFEDDSADKGFRRWVPRPIAFALNDYIRVVYTAPTGHTVKRITGKYNLQEAGQQWKLGVYDRTNSAAILTVITSGAATFDTTLGTPAGEMWLYYQSMANQTATNFNTLHGDFEYCTLYGETGNINLLEIAKDIAAMVAEISTDYSLVWTGATLSLVPFAADPSGEALADLLTRAAGIGGPNNEVIACGIRESDLASDGKPILFVEQVPALTSYDYAVRLDEPNLVASFVAEQNVDEVRNWVAVTYEDQNGRSQTITPDVDATLKDTTSIAAYGQREEWLTISTTDSTIAANYGKRFLASRKDPQWTVSGGITVCGYIRGASGQIIPASEIRAGMRVKVENWLNDLNGTGLTLLITATSFDDQAETCQMTVGRSSSIETWLARVLWQIEQTKK